MNTVEINNLTEPVEPVPVGELSIARYVEPMSESDVIERILAGDLNAMLHNLDLCIQEQCDVCGGSGWIVLTGPDVVHAVCPFCNKDGRKENSQ